jgi:cytochrome c553
MPGFAKSLSDDDIAELASYLRRTRTDRPAWPNLIEAVASNRKSLTASH